MASIRKRTWTLPPNDKRAKEVERHAWVVDYIDESDGKRHIETFNKEGKAKERKRELEHEMSRGIFTSPSASITVAEAGELWIEQCELEELERATVRQYRQHLDRHITVFIGSVKLAALTPATVTALENKLIKKGRSAVMARKVITSLGGLLTTAQAHGKVARNVVRERPRARRRSAKRHKKRPEVGVNIPTPAELTALLNAGQGRGRALIVTAILTGLRASELRGLTWNHVDFDSGVIKVRQRADRFNKIGPPKSAAGVRDVPMAPMVVNTLKEWQLACPKGDLDLVFPNGKGNVEHLANFHKRDLPAMQVAAGIVEKPAKGQRAKPKYGLHAFRHAAASLFIEQKLSPKRVQALMGHSSIAVTLDTYTHLFPAPDDDAAAFEQIQKRLVGW